MRVIHRHSMLNAKKLLIICQTVFINNSITVNDVVREVDKRIYRSMRYYLDVRAVTVNGLDQSVKAIQEAEPILRKK